MLKALFIREICTFLSWIFSWLDKKTMVNLKIYDVSYWTKNNYNTPIDQHLKKQGQPNNQIL